jgi:hypothetical protein
MSPVSMMGLKRYQKFKKLKTAVNSRSRLAKKDAYFMCLITPYTCRFYPYAHKSRPLNLSSYFIVLFNIN